MEHPEEVAPNNLKASWAASRKRLFSILEDLVKWENTTNEEMLDKGRAEIRKSWRETCGLNEPSASGRFVRSREAPGLHDPFAGGGTIPLEAQRLGMEAVASDLNPVAVLINKATDRDPAEVFGNAPVNPETRKEKSLIEQRWRGAQGLIEDVRYYGHWMQSEAEKRLGYLYPKIAVTADTAKDIAYLKPLIGQRVTVIAWLWARTVKTPESGISSCRRAPCLYIRGVEQGR